MYQHVLGLRFESWLSLRVAWVFMGRQAGRATQKISKITSRNLFGRNIKFIKRLRMESNCHVDDALLCYNNLIEVNCKNVEKVTVNYMYLLTYTWTIVTKLIKRKMKEKEKKGKNSWRK